MNHKGQSAEYVKDWTVVQFMIRCEGNVRMDNKYPQREILEYFFTDFNDLKEFVEEYYKGYPEGHNIFCILKISGVMRVEEYETVTKVRVVDND